MSKATDLLAQSFPLISDQVSVREVAIILRELQNVASTNQLITVVEFGCYSGTTSLFIQRFLQDYPGSSFHVYDSFDGLPAKTTPDQSPAGEQFVEGELHASKKLFVENFKKANLSLPTIHKAWFKDLTPQDVPSNIGFAFLDGDYYESINDSLRLIENKLLPGFTVIVDDFSSEALPGAKKAVDEWLIKNPSYQIQTEASLAIIRGGRGDRR